ncbi:MAG: hypothetical protein ACI8WM_000136 [Burkholderiaceae bacterium]|jgi:hypothetical protein
MSRITRLTHLTSRPLHILLTIVWVFLLALFFAQTEIQIEGGAGWAINLPTWRVEHHWLLDLFWGGRAMTGYHAWVFPFITLFFHFPLLFVGHWSWRAESRVVACIMLFWIAEDFLWFVMNPAFGLARFDPVNVTWHKHWAMGAPVDYWIFSVLALVLLRLSYQRRE